MMRVWDKAILGNGIMEDKSADSHTMEASKAALVQVVLDAAKGIGKTPSEQNGFLITSHSKIKESQSM